MGQPIRDLITTDLVQLDAERPVVEAARLMRDEDVGNVLVLRGTELCGILTDRDVVVRCVAEGSDPTVTTLEEICSAELTTLGPDIDSEVAERLMAKKAIRRVPVVEDGRPIGILSLGDLAQRFDQGSALGAISAAAPNA